MYQSKHKGPQFADDKTETQESITKKAILSFLQESFTPSSTLLFLYLQVLHIKQVLPKLYYFIHPSMPSSTNKFSIFQIDTK